MFGKTLFVAAAFVATVYGAACPDTELSKYLPIASNPALPACTKDSGFSLVPPSGLPTDDQLKKMCVSDNCKNVIKIVSGVGPSDCDLNALGVIINVGKLVGSFDADCKRVLGGSPTPAPAPGPTPAPGPAPSTPSVAPTPSQNNGQTGQKTPAPAPVDNSC